MQEGNAKFEEGALWGNPGTEGRCGRPYRIPAVHGVSLLPNTERKWGSLTAVTGRAKKMGRKQNRCVPEPGENRCRARAGGTSYVRLICDDFVERTANAVPSLVRRVQRDWIGRCIGCLQPRAKPLRVPWLDARIVASGFQQDRGVSGAVHDLVIRRIRIEHPESITVLDGAVLGQVRPRDAVAAV